MNLQIEATFANGVLKPDVPLPLTDQQRVRLTVQTDDVEPLTPDTKGSLSGKQMARAFRELGKPAAEDQQLPVDPDDYPLF